MEVLLLSLFLISVLIIFIGGKDDFGRKESEIKKEEVKLEADQEVVAEEDSTEEEVPNKLEEIEKKTNAVN